MHRGQTIHDRVCLECRARIDHLKADREQCGYRLRGGLDALKRGVEARTAAIRAEKIAAGEGDAPRHWQVPTVAMSWRKGGRR
jgi:hypothetical protein